MKFKGAFVVLVVILLCSCGVQDASSNAQFVQGQVLANPKIANEGFDVQLRDAHNEETVAVAHADKNGEYAVPIAEDGDYILCAVNTGEKKYKSSQVSFSVKDKKVSGNGPFVLLISDNALNEASGYSDKEPLVVKGRVKYSNPFDPLDIQVLLCKKKGEKPIRIFTVDSLGEFQISNISDGVYYLCAETVTGETSPWVVLEVKNDEVVSENELTLEISTGDDG